MISATFVRRKTARQTPRSEDLSSCTSSWLMNGRVHGAGVFAVVTEENSRSSQIRRVRAPRTVRSGVPEEVVSELRTVTQVHENP
jgi:hypothetical protein